VPDQRRLLVFDLTAHVHLPSYLRFLIGAWNRRDSDDALDLLVHPVFMRTNADVVALAAASRGAVRFLTLSQDEHRQRLAHAHPAAAPHRPPATTSFADVMRGNPSSAGLSLDWQILHRYAARERATHVLIVHLDSYLPLLACGVEPPCRLSGIFFNSTFHHPAGAGAAGSDPRRAVALHHKFLLARTLRQPLVHRVFFLDPFAADAAMRMPGAEKVRYLPDPVEPNRASAAQVAALRARLGIAADRRVLLLFGHLTPRKGCDLLLDALGRLTAPVCRSLCLVLAGPVGQAYRAALEARIDALCAAQPLRCVRQFGYVPDEDVASYFRLADLVVAPYPHHTGSSGIVLLAAAAQRPVLASRHGLVGEWVRRNRLGLAVDTTDSLDIAAGVQRWLAGLPPEIADPDEMKRLADEHAVERFTGTLLTVLQD